MDWKVISQISEILTAAAGAIVVGGALYAVTGRAKGYVKGIFGESVKGVVEQALLPLRSDIAVLNAEVTLVKGDVTDMKAEVDSLNERMGHVEEFMRIIRNA